MANDSGGCVADDGRSELSEGAAGVHAQAGGGARETGD